MKKETSKKDKKMVDILDEEEEKNEGDKTDKSKRRESVARRKKAKEMDRAARWSGFVLLVVIMLLGFLLWVSGKMKVESIREQNQIYIPSDNSIRVR